MTAELIAYWPNALFVIALVGLLWLYLKWVGFGPTPAEKAREEGRLIYDEEKGTFVTVEVDDE